MSERPNLEPVPRKTTILEMCNVLFDRAQRGDLEGKVEEFVASNSMTYEKLSYETVWCGSKVNVWIMRGTQETDDFFRYAEGTIDERPTAAVWINSGRHFLLKLLGGQKYYADKGFLDIVILSDGEYIDVKHAFYDADDEEGLANKSIGSVLFPISRETSWAIQEIIDPDKS